jgi:hypothetical protein
MADYWELIPELSLGDQFAMNQAVGSAHAHAADAASLRKACKILREVVDTYKERLARAEASEEILTKTIDELVEVKGLDVEEVRSIAKRKKAELDLRKG